MTLRDAARLAACAVCVTPWLTACGPDGDGAATVIADLSQPRGISVDGGSVCVAEAGAVSDPDAIEGRSDEIRAETGRIICRSTLDEDDKVVLDGLPFVYYPTAAVTSGATDVIHHDDALYALIGEAVGPLARSIVAIDTTGVRQVADLLTFAERTAGASGGTVGSNPYSFVLAPDGSAFFVADAATGSVLRVAADGEVSTFAAVAGHEVLTGMTWGPDGRLYVASFGQLPHPDGSGSIVAVDMTGAHEIVADDLTMPIDVGFDSDGGMFVLEYSSPEREPTGSDAYRDRTGRLSYFRGPNRAAEPVELVEGLARPTALAITDSDVLISLAVAEQGHGEGSVVRFALADLMDRRATGPRGDDVE